MMISPQVFYEFNLKDRSTYEIESVIKGLKISIGMLKRTMEHPEYNNHVHMCPGEDVRLSCARDYLDEAKRALAEAGGSYNPSKAELAAADFEENIPFIEKVKFSVGGFFGGFETHTITLSEDALHHDVEHSLIPKPVNLEIPADDPMTKDAFLQAIRWLHIGEWRHYYDTRRFGYEVLDGTQWELEIAFSNGRKPFTSAGSNAYPYNFREFEELF